MRCKELIERWLHNASAVRRHQNQTATDGEELPGLWPSEDACRFDIGRYVGQGRSLNHCGITEAILYALEHPDDSHLWYYIVIKRMQSRPWRWHVISVMGLLIVLTAFCTAFLVSFHTGTQGVGCRSFSYCVWFILSLLTWSIQFCSPRPPHWAKNISKIANSVSTVTLLAIMVFQVTGALNNCWCKSSLFLGSIIGGYMGFGNQELYRRAYNVERIWISASTLGLASCVLFVIMTVAAWWASSHLLDQDMEPELHKLLPPYWLV